jgi:hypothetical protein
MPKQRVRQARTFGRIFRKGQALIFPFHDSIALASACLEPVLVEHRDVAAPRIDIPRTLQLSRNFRDALAANAEHCGNEFLRRWSSNSEPFRN